VNLQGWKRYLATAWAGWSVLSRDLGWTQSVLQRRAIDRAGQPLPWYTYPATEYLRTIDFTNARVFEYGSGHSSVFWARISKEVHCVEDKREWAASVREFGVPNLTVYDSSGRDDYVRMPERVGGLFDVVVIDGRFRHDCVHVACRVSKPTGIIVFDNADWYPEACRQVRDNGWFQIDFAGFGPINPYRWNTSLFFKVQTHLVKKEVVRPVGGIRQDARPDE
jgi:hypothetical protein